VADRKSIIPLTIRLRGPLHGKVVRAAKAHDVSTNEEIERRLESSFEYEDWQKEREQEPARRQTSFESLLDLVKTIVSLKPEWQNLGLTALETYVKASEEKKKEIERANEKEWMSKRLTGESPPTREDFGQPPQKQHKPPD
jgi:hypothetical protein